ncbi:MAG: thioesterase family protein [Solirubrobacterales bacterium]
MPLIPGMSYELPFEVTEDLATDVAGSVANRVLATPRMIAVMERTSMQAVWAELPEGATCVGYEVCVKHVSSAPYGGKCLCTAILTDVVDGRKLRFDVKVEFDGRVVGTGTHERRIIGAGKFDERNDNGRSRHGTA